ncbi:MAG: ketopantoate reductase family protein [Actinobacteria bacterium]|nr:ketopantoate reductase family protein [Actinomycetota bacterium]
MTAVLVIGAGAIGGTVAARLADAGHAVAIAEPWAGHAAAIRAEGLRLTGVRGDLCAAVAVYDWAPGEALDPGLAALRPEVAILATKSAMTAPAVALVAAVAGPETDVLTLQNGIHEDQLREALGARVVGAVTEIGGYVEGPGRIFEARRDGGFVIGELDGSRGARIERLGRLLDAVAPTTVSADVRANLWSKLTWNCMMNPLCAVSGLGQGELWTNAGTRRLTLAVGREAMRVAAAQGIELAPLDFFGVDLPRLLGAGAAQRRAEAETVEIYRAQMGKTTSMSQDVAHGRATEIDAINGHVVGIADRLGLEAPLNRRVVELVHAAERGAAEPRIEVLDELVTDAEGVR